MDFGRAIRVLRAARNLSQKELAQRTGLDPSYISLLEKNRRTPSVDTIQSLASVLEVPPYLLTLIASDAKQLRGLTPDQAKEIGRLLLDIVLDAPEEAPA